MHYMPADLLLIKLRAHSCCIYSDMDAFLHSASILTAAVPPHMLFQLWWPCQAYRSAAHSSHAHKRGSMWDSKQHATCV